MYRRESASVVLGEVALRTIRWSSFTIVTDGAPVIARVAGSLVSNCLADPIRPGLGLVNG